MFRPVLEPNFKIFFMTKYNTIVSIFSYVFIGIINDQKFFFLLYLLQFYTDFLSQSRHLQFEVGADDFGSWNHLKQKNKKVYCSVC